MNFNSKVEKFATSEVKKDPGDFSIVRSPFLNKLFWLQEGTEEIIQVQDLTSHIIRKIGDEVISNGKSFKSKGVKGVIKSFKDDTCYIGVGWEDGTVSFMKDKDLMELYGEEKLEKEFLIKKGIEVFDAAYTIAQEQGNNKLASKMITFKREIGNADLKMEDLLYTIKECQKFIDKNKKKQ